MAFSGIYFLTPSFFQYICFGWNFTPFQTQFLLISFSNWTNISRASQFSPTLQFFQLCFAALQLSGLLWNSFSRIFFFSTLSFSQLWFFQLFRFFPTLHCTALQLSGLLWRRALEIIAFLKGSPLQQPPSIANANKNTKLSNKKYKKIENTRI